MFLNSFALTHSSAPLRFESNFGAAVGENCPKCGNPVDGHYCQGCALLQNKFKEDLFTYFIENGILQDSSKPSNDNTNVVNALQEPFVVNQDPGKNSSQSPPQINHHCCYECGDLLEDIFCHQCTCELCGRGAYYGYNCPSNVLVVLDPGPFNNQTVDEFPQTLPSFDPTCYSKDGNSFTYDSTSNLDHDSPNVFDPPFQPPLYLCEFCGNDTRYGHYCTPQVPFVYSEPCYNQDFNFPQDFHDFQQQYLCCENCGGPHEAYQYQSKDFSDSNDDLSSNDDDSFFIDNIEYVEASPLNSELVGLEVIEIAISKVGGIDDYILLIIKDEILHEKLLNVNLLIANTKALKDNPTPSSDLITKSSSTSLNSLLEETNTFHNSLPEFEIFYFDLEETSSGSTTTRSDIFLPEYEAFYDDHIKEISSGITTARHDSSLYDSFIFDLSINPFPPTDRNDFHEFADELTHIISPPEYDCFYFKIEPNSGDFTMDVVEDTFPTR
uniref:Pre-mRNA splicing Prp18-interacting factor n=1 Tax=Tanacetum cinerariifolium TaxID=118510 RepID=A0A6L2P4Z9_TANCI|nr:hypothetical protein [Tanacetum cinerariifolium]